MGDISKQYVKWIAQYNHHCQYDGSYTMWQYAGGEYGEYVAGIQGRVDSNVWSQDFV